MTTKRCSKSVIGRFGLSSAVVFATIGAPAVTAQGERSDLLSLSLEDLMQIEVTSVSRRGQVLSDTAAAVYVLTSEDIGNSTAVTIPDLLRTVPGMDVAQLDANKWAVSARGFNSRLVSKLLFVIDGRTVYYPTFGAVFWEHQDLLLENIERIEIIRGPGATIWGANAVNGVVSITTKSAHQTKGTSASMLIGNQYEQIVSVQHGGELAPDVSFRLYGKNKKHDGFESIYGMPAGDDWDSQQVGFRIDAQLDVRNNLTLMGDYVTQDINEIQGQLIRPGFVLSNVPNFVDYSGANVVGRWEHSLESGGKIMTQFFYDFSDRNETLQIDKISTYDLDVTYTNNIGRQHQLTVGAGVRHIAHDSTNTPYVTHVPEDNDLKIYNISLNDDIRINDRTILGVGVKIEDNIFTGTEYLPNLRLNYSLAENLRVWAALSRSVRTPSRSERESEAAVAYIPARFNPLLPVDAYFVVQPNDDFDIEELESLEAGWRWSPSNNLTFDVAAYYNRYDQLRNVRNQQPYCVPDPFCATQVDYVIQPAVVANLDSADTKGLEIVTKWRRSNFSLELGYSVFEIDYQGSVADLSEAAAQGLNPNRDEPLYKYNLQGNWDINPRMRLNMVYRYVSEPGIANLEDYHAIDLQYVWEPNDIFSLRLVGRNLDRGDQNEFSSELRSSIPALIEKSVFVNARFSW